MKPRTLPAAGARLPAPFHVLCGPRASGLFMEAFPPVALKAGSAVSLSVFDPRLALDAMARVVGRLCAAALSRLQCGPGPGGGARGADSCRPSAGRAWGLRRVPPECAPRGQHARASRLHVKALEKKTELVSRPGSHDDHSKKMLDARITA